MISGILPVDKPLGWTSHDVVARVRRVAGQKAVGHAGTLDPLATGVLLLLLGRATKLSPYVMDSEKEYLAEVVLGATTATDDGEAPLLDRADPEGVTRDAIEAVVRGFIGTISQVPPAYAAVRQGGKKLYVLARRGETVDVDAREVVLHQIVVEQWQCPRVRLRVRCGAGTYIRALARDIGAALRVGAYLHALRRTRSGSFSWAECAPLEALTSRDDLVRVIVPPDRAVMGWPAALVTEEQASAIAMGQAVAGGEAHAGSVRVYDPRGRLIALAHGGEQIKPFRVFEGGLGASGR